MAEIPRLALSLKESCEALGIGETLFRQEMKAGRIVPTQVGDRLLFPVSRLEAFLEGSPATHEKASVAPEALIRP